MSGFLGRCSISSFGALLLAGAIAAPGDPSSQERASEPEDPARVERWIALGKRCAAHNAERDWAGLLGSARELDEVSAPGSAAWFDARRWLVIAHEQRGELELVERESRAALAAADAALRAEPERRSSVRGAMSPEAAGLVFQIELALARRLQAEGRHEEALGHLDRLLDDIDSRLPLAMSRNTAVDASLESGLSLVALGRFGAARAPLEMVRDGYPEQKAAVAQALAVLAELPGIGDPYRGRFSASPSHAKARAALPAALARARVRLAEMLGVAAEEIPRARLCVADSVVPDVPEVNGVTLFDPRRPCFRPTIAVSAEMLAAGRADLDQVLLHELVHAWLWTTIGIEYERLPAWLAEGLAQAIAGELSREAWSILACAISNEPEKLVQADFWEHHTFDYGSNRSGILPTQMGPFLVVLLSECVDGDGVAWFASAIRGGVPWHVALKLATGMDPDTYHRRARLRADRFLAERWQQALPRLRALDAARSKGLEEAVRHADELLDEPLDPLTECRALCVRAEALEALGRDREAERAWSDLGRAVPRIGGYWMGVSQLGRARCLERLGERSEAARLAELARDTAGSLALREQALQILRSTAGR